MPSWFERIFKGWSETYFRPPGAQSEKNLLATCIKCGRCMTVCPYQSIKIADWGSKYYGTPYIEPEITPCYLCMKCPEVCPTGSLRVISKENVQMGRVQVLQKTCLSWQDDLCNLCYKRCPLQDRAIVLNDDLKPVIENCVGCGVCFYVCPTKPKSIVITPQRNLS
ncbi:MAG: hypothetical protein RIT27_574 [Pseudomonadota bacterium]|jgi:MauM/NapG family ferredoxin protein